MLYQEELTKLGLKPIEQELFMGNVRNFVELNMPLCLSQFTLLLKMEYNKWLEEAKVKFAKEETENKLK